MTKSIIFDQISQMENSFSSILKEYPFKDLIINEILNSSIIAIRELDKSSFNDLDTSKRMVRMQIKKFFEPKNVQKLVNKYWNDGAIQGFTYINSTKENLLKFRQNVDINNPKVIEIMNRLMNMIDEFVPKIQSSEVKSTFKYSAMIKVSIVLLGIVLAFMLYLNALNHRYKYIDDYEQMFDNWSGKFISIDASK